MKRINHKILAILTISLLTVSMLVSLTLIPSTDAHDPPKSFPTWTYLVASTNLVGVGQEIMLVFWSNAVPPTAQGTFGDKWTFTIDVISPNGENKTLGPFESDPVGGSYTNFTPTETGNYTFIAKMVEHKITGQPTNPFYSIPRQSGYAFWNDTFLASSSDPVNVAVQQDPIPRWSETPLPSEFWTRPINNMNRDWYTLAGNWLAGAAQKVNSTTGFGYGPGPESAHVMWATPMWAGGIMDERFGTEGYNGIHYEGLFFDPPIILNGNLYYNTKSNPQFGWHCLNLYTGEEEYFHNTTGSVTQPMGPPVAGTIYGESLKFGQILVYNNFDQYGGIPYLWSIGVPAPMYGPPTGPADPMMMFDAYTGNYICSIANVSTSGTQVYGNDGSILYFNLVGSGANKRLTVWNTTQAIWWPGTQQQWQNQESVFQMENYYYWRPVLNKTYDGSHGFFYNVSIPDVQGSILAVRDDKYVIGGTLGYNDDRGVLPGNLWALNLDRSKGAVGTLLWNITYTTPKTDVPANTGVIGYRGISGPTVDPESGVFVLNEGVTRRWWGYSLETGQKIWGPTESENPMNVYGVGSNIYQGKLLSYGYGGELYAYDMKTGELAWKFTAANEGFESPYGNYPLGIGCIADGKIYLGTCEHSPGQPLWRGSYVRCINASDGEELWKFSLFGVSLPGGASGSNFAISDGYLVALNIYDNQIYCFGKGPSATTVTAPDTAIPAESVAMIRGTVTDQCAGAKKIAEQEGFSAGVAAVSVESQRGWMEYLYQQQAKPTNATGVPVSIDAVDPNGNYIHIGDTTSDSSGNFGYAWLTPNVPGQYTITATFQGSEAYYGSSAETSTYVSELSATATPLPAQAESIADMYFIPMSIGIIVVVIIIGAMLALLLIRKRP
jgi:outer membrane protein assembly factor BamB